MPQGTAGEMVAETCSDTQSMQLVRGKAGAPAELRVT